MRLSLVKSILLLTCFQLAFGLVSCKTTAPSAATSKAVQQTEITISFFSKGSGIDREAKKQLEAIIAQANEKQATISVEKRTWGREGEIDYQLTIAPNTPKEQIGQINRLVEASELVRIKETDK